MNIERTGSWSGNAFADLYRHFVIGWLWFLQWLHVVRISGSLRASLINLTDLIDRISTNIPTRDRRLHRHTPGHGEIVFQIISVDEKARTKQGSDLWEFTPPLKKVKLLLGSVIPGCVCEREYCVNSTQDNQFWSVCVHVLTLLLKLARYTRNTFAFKILLRTDLSKKNNGGHQWYETLRHLCWTKWQQLSAGDKPWAGDWLPEALFSHWTHYDLYN